eukprot:1082476_1
MSDETPVRRKSSRRKVQRLETVSALLENNEALEECISGAAERNELLKKEGRRDSVERTFQKGDQVFAFLPIPNGAGGVHPSCLLHRVQIESFADDDDDTISYDCKLVQPLSDNDDEESEIYQILQIDLRPITPKTLKLQEHLWGMMKRFRDTKCVLEIGEVYLLACGFHIYEVTMVDGLNDESVYVDLQIFSETSVVPRTCLIEKSSTNRRFMQSFNKLIDKFPPVLAKSHLKELYAGAQPSRKDQPLSKFELKYPPKLTLKSFSNLDAKTQVELLSKLSSESSSKSEVSLDISEKSTSHTEKSRKSSKKSRNDAIVGPKKPASSSSDSSKRSSSESKISPIIPEPLVASGTLKRQLSEIPSQIPDISELAKFVHPVPKRPRPTKLKPRAVEQPPPPEPISSSAGDLPSKRKVRSLEKTASLALESLASSSFVSTTHKRQRQAAEKQQRDIIQSRWSGKFRTKKLISPSKLKSITPPPSAPPLTTGLNHGSSSYAHSSNHASGAQTGHGRSNGNKFSAQDVMSGVGTSIPQIVPTPMTATSAIQMGAAQMAACLTPVNQANDLIQPTPPGQSIPFTQEELLQAQAALIAEWRRPTDADIMRTGRNRGALQFIYEETNMPQPAVQVPPSMASNNSQSQLDIQMKNQMMYLQLPSLRTILPPEGQPRASPDFGTLAPGQSSVMVATVLTSGSNTSATMSASTKHPHEPSSKARTSQKTYVCKYCGSRFLNHRQVGVHMKKVHPEIFPNLKRCPHPKCEKTFVRHGSFVTHVASHAAKT